LPSPSSAQTSGLIKQAHDSAEKNKWIEAADSCRKALNDKDSFHEKPVLASLTEFSAKCHFKASFQARSRNEFEDLMTNSKTSWETALTLYEAAQDAVRSERARLGIQLAEFWVLRDPRKRAILAESIVSLFEESARTLEDTGSQQEAQETRLDLLGFFRDFINLCIDSKSLKETFDQAVRIGRSSVLDLRKQKPGDSLAQALGLMIWLLGMEGQVVVSPEEFQGLADETRNLQSELQKTSQEVSTPFAHCQAKESAGHIAFDITGDSAQALKEYEEGLAMATTLADSLTVGRLQWLSSQAAYWLGYSENNPERKRELFKKGETHALNAISSLEISFQTSELSAAHAAHATCLVELANLAGLDGDQKKTLLHAAVDTSSKGAQYESGTWAWSIAAQSMAKALHFLSRLEERKLRIELLREVLTAREKIMEVTNRLSPHFWTNVVAPYHLALVRSELATFEYDTAIRKDLLTKAVSEIELCLKRGEKWGTSPGFLYRLAEHSEAYGEILSKLYSVTSDPVFAHKAVKAYEKAIDRFRASESTANIAALRWEVARIHDNLRSLQLASDEFRKAAADYRKAVSDVPGSASLFEDLAHYLDAWSVIEAARLQHDEAEYLPASEHYFTAARLLGESREWAHLSPLFKARSLLEKGEGLSSEEKHPGATESFKAAINQFREEAALLEKKLQETNDAKEKGELENWLEIARQRESHCRARLELEEARAFDKKGDKTASARKFRNASEMLTTLVGIVSDVQERAELEGLAKFCDGWARMKEAEAKASPELYAQAAESFLKLRSTQTKGQLLHLALANAAICRALGAGVQFQQTRDVQYYSEVKKQTEAAAESFRAAGFRKTEAWTRATQRLFDSLIFITDAESERDATRKRELYRLAENHLEFAARLYGEAGFPTRKEEALGHLERIREEKQVLLAPLEVLSQIPTATAATMSMSPRGRGQPVGTQRFDEAYVVGDLNIPQREVPLGSILVLDLDIANVGKAPATLVKLQNVLPEGFELVKAADPEISLEGELELNGKNLEHLKTHAVKVEVRAARKGAAELRPRLFYIDDSGRYKTYQFRPTTVTVLDVGFPDKPIALVPQATPGSLTIGEEFRFDTERSRLVFQQLVREFLVDYMSRRLYVDKAGWRTLVQIVRETKIPRSALYGPGGRDGPVLAELERRGLVESRIFPKERGRGGAVKRVRVAYDNAIVKKIVEQSVIENK
jgi:hypothetical protein